MTVPEPPTAAGRHAAESNAEPSLGQLVSDASASISTIVRGEIELAKLELKSSLTHATVGIGFFVGALVLLLLVPIFGFVALGEGLVAIGIWRWAAYLIVVGALLLLVGASVFLGIGKVKRVKAPTKTIETGKDTVAYLKKNTKRSK